MKSRYEQRPIGFNLRALLHDDESFGFSGREFYIGLRHHQTQARTTAHGLCRFGRLFVALLHRPVLPDCLDAVPTPLKN